MSNAAKEVLKWDPERREYDPIKIPADCKLFSFDMEEKVRCPHCGKAMLYGNGFTSKQIHSEIGFGYIVCAECCERELEEEDEARRKREREKERRMMKAISNVLFLLFIAAVAVAIIDTGYHSRGYPAIGGEWIEAAVLMGIGIWAVVPGKEEK